MLFYGIMIVALILLILFLLPVVIREIILKIAKIIFVIVLIVAILYGFVKLYKELGAKQATLILLIVLGVFLAIYWLYHHVVAPIILYFLL